MQQPRIPIWVAVALAEPAPAAARGALGRPLPDRPARPGRAGGAAAPSCASGDGLRPGGHEPAGHRPRAVDRRPARPGASPASGRSPRRPRCARRSGRVRPQQPLGPSSSHSASGTPPANSFALRATSAGSRAPTSTVATAGWRPGKASAAAGRLTAWRSQMSASWRAGDELPRRRRVVVGGSAAGRAGEQAAVEHAGGHDLHAALDADRQQVVERALLEQRVAAGEQETSMSVSRAKRASISDWFMPRRSRRTTPSAQLVQRRVGLARAPRRSGCRGRG